MAGSSSSETVKCPYHPEAALIEDNHTGDVICRECGLVVRDRVIDVSSEWQTFSKKKSRVGDAELSGYYRSLMNASTEMAHRRNVSKKIRDKANELSNQFRKFKSLKGRRKTAIAAACLYIACLENDEPRTFKEVSAISNVPKKETGRCFILIRKALETSMDPIPTADFMGQFFSRYNHNLNLPPNVKNAATHIGNEAVVRFLVSGQPRIAVAAAATYMASQTSEHKVSLEEIVRATGMANFIIRLAYKPIYDKAADLFPSDFEFSTPVDQLPKL